MAGTVGTTNLGDSDVLSQYPSAASPLSIEELLKAQAVKQAPASWSQGYPSPTGERGAPGQTVSLGPADQGAAPVMDSAQPAPAPGAGPVPSPDQNTARAGLGLLRTNLEGATKAAGEVPTTNPELDSINQRIDRSSVPTALRQQTPADVARGAEPGAEGTGKILPQFAPSMGQRILRGLKAGAVGFLTGGLRGAALGAIDPAAVGTTPYGAPNSAYQRTEQAREENLSGAQAQEKPALDAWKAAVEAQKERAGQYRANATLGKDLTTGATGLINASTNAAKAAGDTPEARATEKNLLEQKEYDRRVKTADSIWGAGRGGEQRVLYLLNGKVPDPRQATAEEIARGQSLKLFRQQNGRDPQNLDELNQVNAAAGGHLKDIPDSEAPSPGAQAGAKAGLAEITAFTSGLKRQADGSYLSTDGKYTRIGGNVFDAKVNEMRQKANRSMVKTGWQIDENGQLVKIAPPAGAAPAKGGSQPAPDGTRRQSPKGVIEVKRGGKWVPE